MGAARISRRTILTLIFTASQIPVAALTGVKTSAVSGEEGETLYFTCKYPQSWLNNTKYLCRMDDYDKPLIRTDRQNRWERKGRFSLYDNTTAAFLQVKVDGLVPQDSGTYWCGVDVSSYPDHISVILLNVSQDKKVSNVPTDVPLDKLNMPLFLTAAMCVAAILFVCLFTLCLLYAVKHQRAALNRETSGNYETMTPAAGPEREPAACCICSHSDHPCSALPPPPPPDLCSHVTPNHRESAATLSDYADVEARQYQQLDLSQLEDHVYHKICGSKD